MPPVPENVDLVIPNDGGCFGCSPSNPRGMHLTFRRVGDEVRVRHAIPDAFHGAPGVAHGGIVATLLDEISCVVAVFLFDAHVVTGELSVRYERPVPVETPLEIAARMVSRAHPRYAVIDGEVRCDGERLARSTGKFFYQDRRFAAP